MNSPSFTGRTFEEAQAFYQTLPKQTRLDLRRLAAKKLKDEGSEEIGSSDVSCKVMAMLNWYEKVDDVLDNC